MDVSFGKVQRVSRLSGESMSLPVKNISAMQDTMESKISDTQPFFDAIAAGNLDSVKSFLARGLFVDSRDQNDLTGLMVAAFVGDVVMVNYLLNRGADIDAQDPMGFTPLIYAVLQGQDELVSLLLSNDADVFIVSSEKKTALDYAWEYGFKNIYYMILNNDDKLDREKVPIHSLT